MEENQNEQGNDDVSQEEVDKVIAENGNQDTIEEYKDLSEEEAKEELDNMVVPENPVPVTQPAEPIQPVTQPSAPIEGQSGTDQLTTQPEKVLPVQQAPVSKEDIRMKFLQFQCDVCQFKVYVNLDDDKLEELPEKLKCINCGKKKSTKKRIMDITLHGYVDYVEPVELTEQTEEDEEEIY